MSGFIHKYEKKEKCTYDKLTYTSWMSSAFNVHVVVKPTNGQCSETKFINPDEVHKL